MLVAGLLLLANEYSSLVRVDTPPTFPAPGTTQVTEIPVASPILNWNQAIVSWNVKSPQGGRLRLEARLDFADHQSKWFVLADWSADASKAPRQSLNDQEDEDGDVETDTLLVKGRITPNLLLRVTQESFSGETAPDLSLLTVCFADSSRLPAPQRLDAKVKAQQLNVPLKFQGDYPNGSVLCSPTSLCMLINYWGKKTGLGALDVPEVAAAVYDPVWKGTGNWPFNTAFAGSQPGLRSYVTRLNSFAELTRLVGHGIPVATSVAYGLLKGKEKRDNDDGHLVVVTGFTDGGDLRINDPGKNTGGPQIYLRRAFEKAWAVSGNTVYIVHPEGQVLPGGKHVPWLTK